MNTHNTTENEIDEFDKYANTYFDDLKSHIEMLETELSITPDSEYRDAIDGLHHHLVIQIYDEGGDMNTGFGGNSIWIDEEDIADDDFSLNDVYKNPERFIVEGDEEIGFWIEKKNEKLYEARDVASLAD